MKLWDFVNDINGKQENLIRDSENEELAEKTYVPFVVTRQFSYFPDTIMYAQQLNQNHHNISNKMHYEYLLNTVRPRKRYTKWAKRQESDDLDLVRRHYGYDYNKGEQALALLSPDDLRVLRERYSEGGM